MRVAGAVVTFLRKRGVTLFVYLEDWLIVGESMEQTSDNFHKTLQVLYNLGWVGEQCILKYEYPEYPESGNYARISK